MLYPSTLSEIQTNTNYGVEYEIAMFYALLSSKRAEQEQVMNSIQRRTDSHKVLEIIRATDTCLVMNEIQARGLSFDDVSFETQNDEVGPADLVLHLYDRGQNAIQIGLSVKYKNANFHNPTGRRFLTEAQITRLRDMYNSTYLPKYCEYMTDTYGHASNWHRKRSPVTDEFIDKMRDEVISNWPNVADKHTLLEQLLHADSPIPFWVIDYNTRGYTLATTPPTIDESRANDVIVRKYCTSYVAFVIDERILAKVQVKFNNGFIESLYNHKGLPKRKSGADFVVDGLEFLKGEPFGSWDFTLGE